MLKGTNESIDPFFWNGDDRLVFSSDVGGNESFSIGSPISPAKNAAYRGVAAGQSSSKPVPGALQMCCAPIRTASS